MQLQQDEAQYTYTHKEREMKQPITIRSVEMKLVKCTIWLLCAWKTGKKCAICIQHACKSIFYSIWLRNCVNFISVD